VTSTGERREEVLAGCAGMAAGRTKHERWSQLFFLTGSAIRADLPEAGDLLIKEVPCVLIYFGPAAKRFVAG